MNSIPPLRFPSTRRGRVCATDRRSIPAFTLALMAAGLLSATTQAQVQSAGELFVNVDATALAEGPVTSIANSGTLGGVFQTTGGDSTMIPVIATAGGTKGIQFDGTDFLQLATGAGGDLILAPAGLTGESPTRSIEVWALNPDIASEETLVSWGHRGGPDGSNMSFNYGSNLAYGAVGHWGSPDIGWNNNGGGPAADKWHHLVYTQDGSVTRIYADGDLANFEYLEERILNTYPDTPISIGSQVELDADGNIVPTGGLRASMTIARVRIHDGVLTPEQIKTNYDAEKAAFIDPEVVQPPVVEPAKLAQNPTHRYSFNESAADAPQGTEFRDSIGTAHGTVMGDGATLTGSRLALPGGSSSSAAYGDLPNGLMSENAAANGGSGQFTVETWFKHTGSRTWSRVIDFGSTSNSLDGTGEEPGPGGGGDGLDYLILSAQIGDDVNTRRLEVNNRDPEDLGNSLSDIPTSTFNTETHLVITWDEASGAVELYENGTRTGGIVTAHLLSDMNDVNDWLGRSNWSADQNTQGEYDEVRLYDHVLSPGEVLGNYLAGPELLNTEESSLPAALYAQPTDVSVPANQPATFRAVTSGSTPMSVQWLRDGTAIPGATSPIYTLPVAQPSDSGARFSVVISNTVDGSPVTVTSEPAVLAVVTEPVTLKHRYSFNEDAASFAIPDSVGGADGVTWGNAIYSNGELVLDGTLDTYGDLPNGILSGLGENGTIELWTTYTGSNAAWSRLWTFGISDQGEDLQGSGVDFFFLTPRNGDGLPRFVGNGPTAEGAVNFPQHFPLNTELHLVVTWNYSGNQTRLFYNGVPVASTTAPEPLSAMQDRDVNNWLGRSQWSADAYCAARYNEFRLYSGAMTPEAVALSYATGPEALPQPRPTLSVARGDGNVVVTFTGTLEAADAVTGPFSAVAGTTSPATLPTSGAQRYFRARN